MAEKWLDVLRINPIGKLLAWDDPALHYHVRQDFFHDPAAQPEALWELKAVIKLLSQQQPDGSWRYRGKSYHPETGAQYDLLETFRQLRVLVEMYGLNRDHGSLQKAAEYALSYQTGEGDIRGIIGNQYMPYYHGAILELLIKAGYGSDQRVVMGLDWLLSVRQSDGGWIVPTQAVPSKERTSAFWLGPPVPPDRNLPHAHLATGMVLRSLAAHPAYQHKPEVYKAGVALKSRFFQADKYNDRKTPAYWLKFQYPFWWSNLLTALDSLFWVGFDRRDPDIARGLDWFVTNQSDDGLWETGYGAGKAAAENRHWVGLAVCRVLVRYFLD